MAHAQPGAGLLHQIGRVGHALHAAGDDAPGAAGLYQVRRQHRGLHARAAHLVDSGSAGAVGNARGAHGLPGRRLANAGAHHVAHQHLVDGVGGDARVLDRGADGVGAELRRTAIGKCALEAADGRALGTEDVGV